MENNRLTDDERRALARTWLDWFVEFDREGHNVNDVGIAYASEQGSMSSKCVSWDRVAADFAREVQS